MQRISVHITNETKQKINLAAKAQNKLEAEVLREAITAGLEIIVPKSRSARALLDLARKAETLPTKKDMPRDISKNLDYYAWGGEKKDE